ncbi:RIP metalloprotease [Candidatus Saccharibacteria bacterium]|nr:RIP metalloprotease [Candidatus Saccharibacteria bacterium]
MDIVIGIIIGIIVLTLLVVVHELGHALVAKKHGVVVQEFGVGFPPKAWSRTVPKSILGENVEYSVNWLPLGGFVKLQGEHDAARKKGDYGAVTFWQKTQILLAGVAMNWLTAAILLASLAYVGMPVIVQDQFRVESDTQIIRQPVELVAVSPGLPAEEAGLRQGDKILKVNGSALEDASALSDITLQYKGKEIDILYSRNNIEYTTTVKPRASNEDNRGYIGASPAQQDLLRSTWSAPIVGIGTTIQMSVITIQGIGDLLANTLQGLVMKVSFNQDDRNRADEKLAEVGDSVAGPVGIFGIIFPAAGKAGLMHVVMLAAIISLTLAVMNILPIPALDGGRWFVTALFRVFRRPLGKDLEEKIHGTGFMILMGLVLLITIADIGKFR